MLDRTCDQSPWRPRWPRRLTYPLALATALGAVVAMYLTRAEAVACGEGLGVQLAAVSTSLGLGAGLVAPLLAYLFGRKVDVLEETAMRDEATGLGNRRLYDQRVRDELSRARREGTPLALLVLDVDRLKKINDDEGHLQGDAVLRAVGLSVSLSCRRSDVAARYGGDELVVLVPGTTAAQAVVLARRIQDTLARVAQERGLGTRASVSIGIADLQRTSATSVEQLFAAADQALLHAKTSSRHGGGLALAPRRTSETPVVPTTV